MKVIKAIKTPFAEISLLENSILYAHYVECRQDNLEEVKQQSQLIKETFGSGLCLITNTTKIKHVSREVRSFLATSEALEGYNALAAIVDNGVSRIAGNMYLSFNKPVIPTKLFTSFEKAHAWILEERARKLSIK